MQSVVTIPASPHAVALAKADYNRDKNVERAPSDPTPALSDLLSKVFPIYVLQPTPRGIIYW